MTKKVESKENTVSIKGTGTKIGERTFYNVGEKPSGFWDFKLKPVFLGHFISIDHVNKKDIFVFEQDETGIRYYLNAGTGLTNALNAEILVGNDEVKILKESGFLLRIEFIGKVKLKNGNTFNNFSVQYSE